MVQSSVSSETTTSLDNGLNPPSHPPQLVVGCAAVVASTITDAVSNDVTFVQEVQLSVHDGIACPKHALSD